MELVVARRPELRDPKHHPIDNPELTRRAQRLPRRSATPAPILLQHPYESFTSSVERFLAEASEDPKVRAIKMTLYRTSSDSQVIEHLIDAARNGKQVAVVVELKARFDEGANIRWANRMEEVGIHVTYGVVGLKTHSKVILVVRQDFTACAATPHRHRQLPRRHRAHVFRPRPAHLRSTVIGEDLTELFNYLTTGYKPKRNYRSSWSRPRCSSRRCWTKIQREIAHATAGQPATSAVQDERAGGRRR
jgi:polyphosphate kinase